MIAVHDQCEAFDHARARKADRAKSRCRVRIRGVLGACGNVATMSAKSPPRMTERNVRKSEEEKKMDVTLKLLEDSCLEQRHGNRTTSI